jgi:hypothetical protein
MLVNSETLQLRADNTMSRMSSLHPVSRTSPVTLICLIGGKCNRYYTDNKCDGYHSLHARADGQHVYS